MHYIAEKWRNLTGTHMGLLLASLLLADNPPHFQYDDTYMYWSDF